MMITCVYRYCLKESTCVPDLVFFRFPEDSELRQKWVDALPSFPDFNKQLLRSRIYLCSDHFEPDTFTNVGGVKRLKPQSIPSIFDIPDPSLMVVATGEDAEPGPDGHEGAGNSGQTRVSSVESKPHLLNKIRFEKHRVRFLKGKLEKLEKKIQRIKNIQSGDELIPEDIQEMLAARKRLKSQDKPRGKKLKKRPKSWDEIFAFLQKDALVSENALNVFHNLFGDTDFDQQSLCKDTTETLRCFVQMLTFYSAVAYEKMYDAFHLLLPPLPALRTWFNHEIGEPGWSHEAFSALKEKAKNLLTSSKLLCSLSVEELDLEQKEEWDGKKLRGYIDYGPQMLSCQTPDSDSIPHARSVLLFMVSPLDKGQSWRIPVAYFLINHLTNYEKANVIRECLWRLHLVGTIISSLTVNFHSTCQGVLTELGIQFEQLPQSPYFIHPADPLIKVYVVFDPCTLLKSVCNMWFDSKLFISGSGGNIDWNFVAELMKVQEAQACTAEGTENATWCWDSSSMKNRLMAQVFSKEIAQTMQYYCHELKMVQFQGCNATVEFILMMSRVSKLLNSQPRFNHKESPSSLIAEALDFILRLADPNGQPLHWSHHYNPIKYLHVTLLSVQALYQQVPQLSMRCMSLDHSHMLFYTIRSYIGWDCLPTAREFVNAFKIHVQKYHYLHPWNIIKVENFWWVDILDVSSACRENRSITKRILTVSSIVGNLPFVYEHAFSLAEFVALDPYLFMCICVVKQMGSVLNCSECLLALQATPPVDTPLLCLLRKTCGGMIHPSRDVMIICRSAEHHLKVVMKTTTDKTKFDLFEWRDENFLNRIGLSVMEDMLQRNNPIFSSLHQHVLECAPDSNHLYRLVRAVTYIFLCMRIRGMKSWCPV